MYAVQINSEVNSDNDYEDQEYMRMIIQQITENEERESKLKQTRQFRSLIEEQDLEYEETLRQDIAKEKQIKYENENKQNKSENETKEKPQTLEDIRKARLAFFEKK